MKRKVLWVVLAIILILSVPLFAFFGILRGQIFIDESPNGDYQIVSWWIDKGAFGYGGAFYLKEKGLLSKWYKIGKVPCSSEWVSETEFLLHYPYPKGEVFYNVKEFT